MLWSFLHGFCLNLAALSVPGPQNLFVLQQGLARRWPLEVIIYSTLGNACLYALVVGDLGWLDAHLPWLHWGNILLLAGYGTYLWWQGLSLKMLPANASPERHSWVEQRNLPVLAILAFSLLNPHAYLDAAVILGSGAAPYPVLEQLVFVMGATVGSAAWFAGLALFGRKLGGRLVQPAFWRAAYITAGAAVWLGAGLLSWRLFT